ncbi:Siderophore synthetase component [Halobacillus karajensis]|uniref:Aerobactin synthase n=1 Tax=Halobacillus karajensis TaxID=195088 RepID=A0A024P8G8_9BACI|nr:IucA/IucC family siderophore biosynthesis protein [Halobacillus karajensis]CDQ20199.1 Aerobactin synthase [Halobacillus karajensis]CDQ25138.1 Aerobactin synthase [Halobacillus karajensis]CDQ28501.1 Aerobactin synthase [Halobacillus karajensis]SEI01876.1 Siderophore synthetase component [Halobacillus karajensis]
MLFQNEIHEQLNPADWKEVNQKLIAKMLAEYMYEDMINPKVLHTNGKIETYELIVPNHKSYQFEAKKYLFDSFEVKKESIKKIEQGVEKEAESAVELLVDLKEMIGMSAETTGHLIKEIHATLIADIHLMQKTDRTSEELLTTDYAELEGFMKGHPWITYNKGRIGFGYDDYLKFAPEQQREVRLSWIAVHKHLASFHSIENLSYEQLIEQELSEEERKRFAKEVETQGGNAENYYFLPVHEWQWKNQLIQNFPNEIARKEIIAVGDGEDSYLPQQSIRTFVNTHSTEKHHVKLPMSILNTLVYRGLPSERTVIAPKVTELIKGMYDQDDFLKHECRVILPGENASINVDQPHYSSVKDAPYQYLEMLGAIWRESIYTYLEEGEQAITLAALLHEDHNGTPFVQSLMDASQLEPEEWMKKFYQVVMDPLLHYLYQYGTVFSPHGQNTILVLKENQPHRLAIKDFVDDVNVTDQPFPELDLLSEEMKTVLRTEPPEGLTQFIFTGLFVCHLRYLSHILENHHLVTEEKFWELLAESIHHYQARFPELEERFELFDFFKPEMTKLCLNRNRMVDYGYADGDDRPHASEFGRVTNALAAFKKQTHE